MKFLQYGEKKLLNLQKKKGGIKKMIKGYKQFIQFLILNLIFFLR